MSSDILIRLIVIVMVPLISILCSFSVRLTRMMLFIGCFTPLFNGVFTDNPDWRILLISAAFGLLAVISWFLYDEDEEKDNK